MQWRRGLAGFVLLGAVLSCNAVGGEVLVRRVVPWWRSNSSAARSVERLRRINPQAWSGEEREQRIFETPAVKGRCGSAKLLFYDLFAIADVFHYTLDESKFQGGFHAVYEVVKPANALLRIDTGSALWWCENMSTGKLCVFYTRGEWDLRKAGVFSRQVPIAGWKSYTGAPFTKGAYVIDKVGLQLYRAEPRKHLKVIPPSRLAPRRFSGRYGALGPKTWFTVADLTSYKIRISEISTDWGRSGYVGVVVSLTDAAGKTFDLPGAEVTATITSDTPHERCSVRLEPRGGIYEKGSVYYRFKFFAAYPEDFFEPRRIVVNAGVWVLGPDGVMREEVVRRAVSRDACEPTPLAAWSNRVRRKDVRADDGKLMESRVLWTHGAYFKWWQSEEKARQLLRAAKLMRVNILGAGMFFAGRSHVRTRKMTTLGSIWKGPDVLEILIKEAHAAGLEVHPTVNCAQGGSGWGGPQLLKEHPEWAVVNQDGTRCNSISDMHRPEFRKYFIAYLVDIARHYDIDGIKLDFTRTKRRCYCRLCRSEYKALTGRDLVKDARPPYTRAFIKWQEDTVSALVRGIREELDKVRPGIKLSHWGHDEPGSPSCQGRRPDIWLNNGWIDWFEIDCYGSDPAAALRSWSRIARMVKRPECVWPALGLYQGATGGRLADNCVPLPRRNEFTGDSLHSGLIGCRRPKVLIPMYETFRDACGVNGFALFDLCYMTKNMAAAYGREMFPEKAVPWYPAK